MKKRLRIWFSAVLLVICTIGVIAQCVPYAQNGPLYRFPQQVKLRGDGSHLVTQNLWFANPVGSEVSVEAVATCGCTSFYPASFKIGSLGGELVHVAVETGDLPLGLTEKTVNLKIRQGSKVWSEVIPVDIIRLK